MMLGKIERIRKFGIFDDFSGSGLQEFRDFNLIYGFNYSGKTTLSRAFACLENRAFHPDYAAAELSFSDGDGETVGTETEPPVKVRVYNEDFRKRHLKWDDRDGIAPVAIIGEEAIETRALIETKSERGQRLGRLETKLGQSIGAMEGSIESAKTACAKRIKDTLSLPGFTKAKVSTIMAGWGDSSPPALSENDVARLMARLNAEEKRALPDLTVKRTGMDAVWGEAVATLIARIGSASTIARLVDKPEIGRWVSAGMVLHKEVDRCEFCDNPLAPDRMAALNAHFSDEHARLMRRIDAAIAALRGQIPELKGEYYTESAFYEEFRKKREDRATDLRRAKDKLKTALDTMADLLEKKRGKPFDVMLPPGTAPDLPSFLEVVDAFNAVISKNNERTSDFAASKQQARDTLTGHIIVRDLLTPENERIKRLCARRAVVRDRFRAEARTLATEVTQLKADISNAAAGAQKLNETLERFFGPGHFRFDVTPDDKFRLIRQGETHPRNLSEGERTAIAFCYFTTRLFADGPDISDTIVYIDDPISSLDANHLHYVDAFIRNTFYKFTPKVSGGQGASHECRAKQVFISTHNSEFFHILWMWLKGTGKDFRRAYMVERTEANRRVSSQIIDCPLSFQKYRSLYLMTFDRLRQFVDDPIDEEGTIFSIGNFARRFLEGYMFLKYMDTSNVDKSLRRLNMDDVDRNSVARFANSGSHLHSSGGTHGIPASTEAVRLVNIVLAAVRNDDSCHYEALEAALALP